MNKTILLLSLAALCTWSSVKSQSLGTIKKFDYRILEDKVLYIPQFDPSSPYAKKLIKKGDYATLENLEKYSEMWNRVMAQSSYDATPYEIRKYDAKKLFKEKNDKAIVLVYQSDKFGNWSANLWVTGPQRIPIASVVINGLNLADENDLRLMMNLLNYSLNELAEMDESGTTKNYSSLRNRYYKTLAEFYAKIDEMTFLVPKSEHPKPKKAAERNADLKAALKLWNISKYKFTTEAEIQKLRLAGDPNSFYWKSFAYYTKSPLITYRVNFLITTEKDEPFFYFMGTKRLKPKTLDEIQKKIGKKAAKYKGS